MASKDPILRFHGAGDWRPAQFSAERIESTRLIVPEVEQLIERAWDQIQNRPGVHLFDGPMCRLESWRFGPGNFHIVLSQTSYKPFYGTNLTHPELADRFGRQVLANPVGVSPAMITADGFLMMGRRNESVAYYPRRVHPFAGSLDPADADPFAAILRELREELSMSRADVRFIRCTGLAEDLAISQPELIFYAGSNLTRAQIESRLDDTEHHGVWSLRSDADEVARALTATLNGVGEPFTPVAIAALLLFGRIEFGQEWFDRAAAPFCSSRQ